MDLERLQAMLKEAKAQQDRAMANANYAAGQVALLQQLIDEYESHSPIVALDDEPGDEGETGDE